MRVLVTGCQGQLGQALMRLSAISDVELLGVSHIELDITDKFQIDAVFKKFKPDLLINTAAYTAVDKAEGEIDAAYRANRDGPHLLADVCERADIPIIHLSTDYVFDGELDRPYSESDAPHPLNVYGESKLAGELAVQQTTERHIILRTSWLFSEHSPNFVSTILKLASSQKELKVVSDQKGGPTSASSVAKLVLRMVKYYREKGELKWGVYHFACEPYCTWYEFAEAILGMAKQRGLINQIPLLTPILSHEYASPATRPLNSMLKNGNVQRDFGVPCCDWRVELEETLQKATLLVS